MVTRLIPVLEIPEDWEFDSLSPHKFFAFLYKFTSTPL